LDKKDPTHSTSPQEEAAVTVFIFRDFHFLGLATHRIDGQWVTAGASVERDVVLVASVVQRLRIESRRSPHDVIGCHDVVGAGGVHSDFDGVDVDGGRGCRYAALSPPATDLPLFVFQGFAALVSQQVAENVEEEQDGHGVQVSEEALQVIHFVRSGM